MKLYSETFSAGDGFGFKIYHYDASGNREIVVYKSPPDYASRQDAECASAEYEDEHDLDDVEAMCNRDDYR